MTNQPNEGSILVLDDEKRQQDIIALILRDAGYEVATTGSPAQALQMVETGGYDVVLTDLRMPGMDGADFLSLVQIRYPDTVRIMLTGHASVESGIQGMQLGAFDYVMKPVALDELLEKAERLATRVREGGMGRTVHEVCTNPSLYA